MGTRPRGGGRGRRGWLARADAAGHGAAAATAAAAQAEEVHAGSVRVIDLPALSWGLEKGMIGDEFNDVIRERSVEVLGGGKRISIRRRRASWRVANPCTPTSVDPL